MKKSIRKSLFNLFIILIGLFILISVVLNLVLLEKYYVFKNKHLMSQMGERIEMSLSDVKQTQKIIEEMDQAEGIAVAIADGSNQIRQSSYPLKPGKEKLPVEVETLIKEQKPEEYCGVVENRDSLPKLIYIRRINPQGTIVLAKQMKGIEESVAISNEFSMIIGMMVFLLGSVLMFRVSRKIAQPIIQMSHISEDISNLNFGTRVDVPDEENEIRALANSINRMSDRLEANIHRMENNIEFQKALSRNMAHELKSPIGVIKGYAEGLEYGVADNPEMFGEYIHTIIEECDRMDHLVMEMLELSKLEAENYVLQDVTQFPISKLLNTVTERFGNIFTELGIQYSCSEVPEIMIEGNFELLERAFLNLLSNAIKYTDDQKRIRLDAKDEKNAIEIQLFNTCPRIPATDLDKLFDPFYKTDKARSRAGGGHGLGLSIVKSIIEMHRGTVAAGNLGDGITFNVMLPKSVG